MWKTRVISDDGLRATPRGFDLDIRLPWYRSLPLSTLRGMTLKFDGETIPQEAMRLTVNGVSYSLDELEALTDAWWHILDSGFLNVEHAPLERGASHMLDLTLSFEIPYVAGAVIPSNCVKTLKVA